MPDVELPALPPSGFARNLREEYLAKRREDLDAYLLALQREPDIAACKVLPKWLGAGGKDTLQVPEKQTAVGLSLLTVTEQVVKVPAGTLYEHIMPLPSPVHLPSTAPSSPASEQGGAHDAPTSFMAMWEFSTAGYDIGFSAAALIGAPGDLKSTQASQGTASGGTGIPREISIIKGTRCNSQEQMVQGSAQVPPPGVSTATSRGLSPSVAFAAGASLVVPARTGHSRAHSDGSDGSGFASPDVDAIAARAAAMSGGARRSDEPLTHIVLRFDNRYSKMRRKTVTFKAGVFTAAEAGAAASAEEAYRTKLRDAQALRAKFLAGTPTGTTGMAPSRDEASILRGERDKLREQVTQLSADVDAAADATARTEARLADAQAEAASLAAQLSAMQQRAEAAEDTAQSAQREADAASERVRTARHQAAEAEGEVTGLLSRVAQAEEAAAEAAAAAQHAREDADAQLAAAKAAQGDVTALQARVAELEGRLAASEGGQATQALQQRLEAAEAEAAKAKAVLAKVAERAKAAEGDVAKLKQHKRLLAGEVRTQRETLKTTTQDLATAKAAALGAAKEAAAAKAALVEERKARAQLEARLAAMSDRPPSSPAQPQVPQEAAEAGSSSHVLPPAEPEQAVRSSALQGEGSWDTAASQAVGTPPSAPAVPGPGRGGDSVPNLAQFRQGGGRGRGRGRGARVLVPPPAGGAQPRKAGSWLDSVTDAVSSVFVPDLPPAGSLAAAAARRSTSEPTTSPRA